MAYAAIIGETAGWIGKGVAQTHPFDAQVIDTGGEVQAEGGIKAVDGSAGGDQKAAGVEELGGDGEVGPQAIQVLGAECPIAIGAEHPAGIANIDGNGGRGCAEAKPVDIRVALDDPEAAGCLPTQGVGGGEAVAVVVVPVGETITGNIGVADTARNDAEIVFSIVRTDVLPLAPGGDVLVGVNEGGPHDCAPACDSAAVTFVIAGIAAVAAAVMEKA